MPDASLASLLPIALVFVAAGAVKGVLGLGLPTLAIGLLGLMMPVAAAASLLTVPSLVTNVVQAVAGPALRPMLRRLWTMQLGIAAGVALSASLHALTRAVPGAKLLGFTLLAYGTLGLMGWRPRPPRALLEPWTGFAAGAATGVLTGLTGVFVIPAVPYLNALGLGRAAQGQALGLTFTTSTLALGALLAHQGHLDLRASTHSLLMVAPALAGMWIGQRLRDAMSEAAFRRCFFAGMVVLGGWLAIR